jgi:hypothetical protein
VSNEKREARYLPGIMGNRKKGREKKVPGIIWKNINAHMCFSCKQFNFQTHPLSMEERLGAATWPPIILRKSAPSIYNFENNMGNFGKAYGLGTL